MGPRPIGRGNFPVAIDKFSNCVELQWGRDQLVAEMHLPPVGVRTSSALQWGRDQLVAEILYLPEEIKAI